MRILCLNLPQKIPTGWHEAFLRFSPKIQVRVRECPRSQTAITYIFMEVSETSHLFKGESPLLKEVVDLAKAQCQHATAVISDTAFGAQALSHVYSTYICEPKQEKNLIGDLPLQHMVFLESLSAWEKVDHVYQIIALFQVLGLSKIYEVYNLDQGTFRERWGKLGEQLWKRLHTLEKQVISPLNANEPLTKYSHFDEPISLTSFLLYYVEKDLKILFQRLHGRSLLPLQSL